MNTSARRHLIVFAATLATLLAGAVVVAEPTQATEVTDTVNGITYDADDTGTTATATAYDGAQGTTVTIPATVHLGGADYDVTAIGDGAFGGDNAPLTSVTIPDSVTSIGQYAFFSLALTSVTIPDSVTTIGDSAFAFNPLSSVHLGSGLTTIEGSAFRSTILSSVTIPDSVTSIGEVAFNLNRLTTVTLGSGLTTLGQGAFAQNHLNAVALPTSLTEIGLGSFSDNELSTVTIPAGVTDIAGNAFAGNPTLTSVNFLGAAPSVVDAGDLGSFGPTNCALVLNYLPAFGEPAISTGFTTPTWHGYNTGVGTCSTSPTIKGVRREGHTLNAHTGLPSAHGATYQWRANGHKIKGAIHKTYELGKYAAGRHLSVSVTKDGATHTSNLTRVIASAKARLVLSRHAIHTGQKFQVTATGLTPDQEVIIWIAGHRGYTGHANTYGVVDQTVKFSPSVDHGRHRIRVSGYNSQGHRTYTIHRSVRYVHN